MPAPGLAGCPLGLLWPRVIFGLSVEIDTRGGQGNIEDKVQGFLLPSRGRPVNISKDAVEKQ